MSSSALYSYGASLELLPCCLRAAVRPRPALLHHRRLPPVGCSTERRPLVSRQAWRTLPARKCAEDPQYCYGRTGGNAHGTLTSDGGGGLLRDLDSVHHRRGDGGGGACDSRVTACNSHATFVEMEVEEPVVGGPNAVAVAPAAPSSSKFQALLSSGWPGEWPVAQVRYSGDEYAMH